MLRIGKSRVLLELVINAFQRGETPEGIVQSYDTLSLPDLWQETKILKHGDTVMRFLRKRDSGVLE